MAKITNHAAGARVVNAVSDGRVVQIALKAGETRELDLLETKPTVARASSGEFKISGAFTDAPKVEASSGDSALQDVTTELKAEKAKVADLEKAVAERDARIADLEKDGSEEGLIKAIHHGGGKFNVVVGKTVLLSGLSKVDADALNEMSQEDRAAYVEAEKAKG